MRHSLPYNSAYFESKESELIENYQLAEDNLSIYSVVRAKNKKITEIEEKVQGLFKMLDKMSKIEIVSACFWLFKYKV